MCKKPLVCFLLCVLYLTHMPVFAESPQTSKCETILQQKQVWEGDNGERIDGLKVVFVRGNMRYTVEQFPGQYYEGTAWIKVWKRPNKTTDKESLTLLIDYGREGEGEVDCQDENCDLTEQEKHSAQEKYTGALRDIRQCLKWDP